MCLSIRHGILLSSEHIRIIARGVDVDSDCDNIAENLQGFFGNENAHCCFWYEEWQPPVTLCTGTALNAHQTTPITMARMDYRSQMKVSVEYQVAEKSFPRVEFLPPPAL